MDEVRDLQGVEFHPGAEGSIVTVGTFDGVHRGHLDVLSRLVARSLATRCPSVLVTFDPHPLELLNPDAAPLLLTGREEKLAVLEGTGLDFVSVLPFDRKLADFSAEEFVERVLRGCFAMRELLVGHDHGFGKGRQGGAETLRSLGQELGFGVEVIPPVQAADGQPVSSTRIRNLVKAGELDAAAEALGRRYGVRGEVVAGEARGRLLGFPTLNVLPETPRKLLPPDGVYAVDVDTARGRFGGMMNLGGRPTFHDERRTIEVHLFDASGDFYGDVVQVRFVARLRDTMRFDGPEALVAQLTADAVAARHALTGSR